MATSVIELTSLLQDRLICSNMTPSARFVTRALVSHLKTIKNKKIDAVSVVREWVDASGIENKEETTKLVKLVEFFDAIED